MLIELKGFKGEIPRVHPTLLKDGFASIASNVRLENGALTPYRVPSLVETLSSNARTIHRLDNGDWISWDALVDVARAPVAADRLYYTGAGVPRMRAGDGVYTLALNPPLSRPAAALKRNTETLIIDGKTLRLEPGATGKTALGCQLAVEISSNVATVTISHPTGITASQASGIINSMRYRNVNTGNFIVSALKIIRITQIQDAGGKTYDSSRNLIGSDTSTFDEIGAVVNVANSPLSYEFPVALEQDTLVDNAGQNDPPRFTATGLQKVYRTGDDAPVLLFTGAVVNPVEPGQLILSMTVTVDGLTNGVVDRSQQETILYAYTYVTEIGEVRPVTAIFGVDLVAGPGVRLSLLGNSSQSGRGVTAKRIYRSQTGESGTTDLYYAGQVDANVTTFDDLPGITPLVEPMPSLDFDPPPDNMKGIVSMPNGMMAAFSGRNLYFCEPWMPHAWPTKYALRTDFDIVGLACFGSSLAILTTGNPYVAQGTHPDSMRMEKVEVNLPCIASRSVVDLGYLVAYATTEGLATINQGGAQLVSRDLFTPRQWLDMNPETFVSSQHQGRYVLSHDDLTDDTKRKCTLIDLTGDKPFIVRTSWRPSSFFFEIGRGRLYYRHGAREIYEFDRQTGRYEMMRWRSKPILTPTPTNFGVMLIEGDKIAKNSTLGVKVYADHRLRDTVTRPNEICRLKSGYRGSRWEFEVTGNFQVSAIYVANTIEELQQRMTG